MHRRRAALLFAAGASVASASRAARAQDVAAPSAQAADEVSNTMPAWFIPEAPRLKSFALEANPLGAAIGLFSVNIEILPVEHHAMVISPHYYDAVPGQSDTLTGGGFEAGYRYYTGRYGPQGFFAGASALFGVYRYLHRTNLDTPTNTSDDTSYNSYGLAIDGGYQVLLREHLVIGGGLGLEYRFFDSQPNYETDSHAHQELIYGSGLRPRFLLAIGGAL